ncbi:MAG: amino acid permease [Cytophagaceae bacterium]|jgi:amino acid transporter|nr:amino acid permease [Cytophagaceae bacterium]
MSFFTKKKPDLPVQTPLHRTLSLRDLVFMGIAAVVGAGIFSTIGSAAYEGGPGVIWLFLFAAFACLLSALCYAEFASAVPLAGSAYTYAYLSFGEGIAWIIGWDLLMEYAIGNIAVAISWSDYFTRFLHQFQLHIPPWLCTDYFSAQAAFAAGQRGSEAYQAYAMAPQLGSLRIIMDLPASLINIVITLLVWIGIQESKSTGNLLVYIKLLVLILIVLVSISYIQWEQYSPFLPNGWTGVFKGTSAVFFAYIGFDAISTTSEEALHPSRDLPRAMLISLAICTLLYIALALVLTGVVPFHQLHVADPLALLFDYIHMPGMVILVSASAIVAMTSVLLVFQLGQPRILMSMSRDGLLPSALAKVHPTFKTPTNATLITGLMVGIPVLFLNHTIVTDLCSIGTLFAFALVCAGCMKPKKRKGGFQVPYMNAQYLLLPLLVMYIYITYATGFLHAFQLNNDWPWLITWAIYFIISLLSLWHRYSLIPSLGLFINLFLIAQLNATNWMRFGIWLAIGLSYYGLRKFSLWKKSNTEVA